MKTNLKPLTEQLCKCRRTEISSKYRKIPYLHILCHVITITIIFLSRGACFLKFLEINTPYSAIFCGLTHQTSGLFSLLLLLRCRCLTKFQKGLVHENRFGMVEHTLNTTLTLSSKSLKVPFFQSDMCAILVCRYMIGLVWPSEMVTIYCRAP